MIDFFNSSDKIKKIISLEELKQLKSFSPTDGSTFLLDHLYFIVEGSIDVFVSDNFENRIKVSTVTPKDFLIGPVRDSDYKGLSLFFRAQSGVKLLSIDEELLERLNKNIDFVLFSRDILFRRVSLLNKALLIKSTSNAIDYLRFSLENLCDDSKSVFISDTTAFIKDFNISKATFTKGLKKLENEGHITKYGDLIKFKEYKFREDI